MSSSRRSKMYFGRDVGLHRVAAGRVHQPLRLSRRPRGVENVQRVFRVQLLGRALRRGFGHQLVPPVVAPLDHCHRRAGAPEDDHMLHRVAGVHRLIDGALELDLVAAPVARVLRQNGDASRIVDPVGNGVGGKSAKDHRVNRPDPRAGQQGNGQLRRHAHVDRHPVALLDAQGLQRVGELLHLDVQLGIRSAAEPRPARPPRSARSCRGALPAHDGPRSYSKG